MTVIDARTAWVVEQYIYDQSGKTLLASAIADIAPLLPDRASFRARHRHDSNLPTANMKLNINLGTVQINQLTADRSQLWTMPVFDGYPQYDLGRRRPRHCRYPAAR